MNELSETARFKGQVVVVTGSARGIGFAAARLFAREGARVFINDLEASAVQEAVGKIEAEGGLAFALPGDVSDEAQVHRNVQQVMAMFGQIDVLVNNAGIIARAESAKIEFQSWRKVLAVNLDGVFLWSQAVAVASMIPRRAGAIVNVASASGMAAIPEAASYVASKHGVVGLTKALAVDWGQYNIRVNAICPGLTKTDLSASARARNPEVFEERERRIPLGRPAETDDQARVIAFLASADAAAVDGLIMNVDGGGLAMASWHAAPKSKN